MSRTVVVIKSALVGCSLAALVGCLGVGGYPSAPTSSPAPAPRPTGTATATKVDAAQVERIKRLMIPLIRVMNNPIPSGQVQLSVVDDPQINAGSAGSGQFIVTTGLLNYRGADEVR